MKFAPVVALALVGLLAACNGKEAAQNTSPADTITAQDLARHIKVLASDDFGGRGPATEGEVKTIAYLTDQFKKLGLAPGNHGQWTQEVPLVSIAADPNTKLTIAGGGAAPLVLDYAKDMMVWTKRVSKHEEIADSDMVFVGYGIVAPEYGWNGYKGLDVRGKTVVILVNDPGYETKDAALFTGRAMTYYGRWTYKYEEAARQGAAGALIIHQEGPAGYGWGTVASSWTGPQFDLVRADKNASRVAIEGWLTEAVAEKVLARAGKTLAALKAAALNKDFTGVPLGLKASVAVDNTINETVSHNVIARLDGVEHPDEYFLYMAHWDHLGTDPTIAGDGIYNGALDNASGDAALLELAEAFAKGPRPKRSILFIAVTAEEQGLLGSAYYAENPVYPLNKTVAGLNIDGINNYGPTREITVVGAGKSELENYLRDAAAAQGRRVDPEPFPEKGYYYRSDHFELAKKGVPMLYTDAGVDSVEHGVEWGKAQAAKYIAERYHKPSDEFDDTWDLSGGVQDVRLYYAVGAAIANSDAWPNWNQGTEFRAIREKSLAGG